MLSWRYIAGAIAWLVLVTPTMGEYAKSLDVTGATSSFGEKLRYILANYNYILSGKYAENMIYGVSVTILNNKLYFVVGFGIIITVLLEVIVHKYDIRWKIVLAVLLIYFICCIFFASRMQPQHFVPLVFITFALVCFMISSIIISLRHFIMQNKVSRLISGIVLFISIGVLFLNLYNDVCIINEIKYSGGEGRWAVELAELADEALENSQRGEKEVYLFCDWGFFAGFDYLTMNKIPFLTDKNIDVLKEFYNDGKSIVACYWNEEDKEEYLELFQSVCDDTGKIDLFPIIDKNGTLEFYKMKLCPLEENPL